MSLDSRFDSPQEIVVAESISMVSGYPLPKSVANNLVNKALYSASEVIPDFLKILKWCLIPIIVFVFYWATEKYLIQAPTRLVYNPAEFPCRVFGFSHYLVGLIFMMSSRTMKKAVNWVWLAGLLAVSIGICVLFYNFGGASNPILVIFYFLFFMFHGYRDVILFYQPQTDDKELEKKRRWIFRYFQGVLILGLMYVLVPAFFLYLRLKPRTYSSDLQASIDALAPYLNALLMSAWIVLLGCSIAMWRLVRSFPGGARAFWRDNRPVMLVVIYMTAIILASPLVGPWTYNLLILSHFVGWYFYASRRLSKVPKQATKQDGLWKWVRGSVAGFQILHLGFAALFLILVLLNHYVQTNSGVLGLLLGGNAFYYWTVIHVTISFAPKS